MGKLPETRSHVRAVEDQTLSACRLEQNSSHGAVVAMESEMLVAPHMMILHCLLKGEMPLTFHMTNMTWNKWTHKRKQGCFSLPKEVTD